MLEELKGGLEAPGCSELLWEDQRETAQLPQAGSRLQRSELAESHQNVGRDG